MDKEEFEKLKKEADATSSETLGKFMKQVWERMLKQRSGSVVFELLNESGHRIAFCIHVVEIDGKPITDYMKMVVKDNGQVH